MTEKEFFENIKSQPQQNLFFFNQLFTTPLNK